MDDIEEMKKLIKELSKTCDRVDPDDYVRDGIIYCHKCHTRKQRPVGLEGEQKKLFFCLCQCESDRRDQLEKEKHEEEVKKQIEDMRSKSFLDKKLKSWNFENDDLKNEKVTNTCKNYIKKFKEFRADGKGLLFYGGIGTGKTFFACCIANAFIDQGKSVLVTNFPRIINLLMAAYDKQAIIDSLNDYEILIIDDLAAERDTDFALECIWNVIDSRSKTKLPTIITTNLTLKDLTRSTDQRHERIYNRLLEMCIPVEVEGANRRKIEAIKSMEYYDSLLKG